MRYLFYREHKYVSFRLTQLERLIAKSDFNNFDAYNTVQKNFTDLIHLLEAHADYENNSLHSLLRAKNSLVIDAIEQDHDSMDQEINDLQNLLDKISQSPTDDEKIEAGYHFYREYRKFVGKNLIHLYQEETIILPELHRLYTDQELQQVERATYCSMTAEELIEMVQELFAHMNSNDWEAFLYDIKCTDQSKFNIVWEHIKSTMTSDQQENLIKKLNLN